MLGFVTIAAAAGIGAALWLMYVGTVRRRAVLEALRERHPRHYESIAAPTPGRLMRGAGPRLDRFLHERHDLDLDDPALTAACESVRRVERQWLVLLFAGIALLGIGMWLARDAA